MKKKTLSLATILMMAVALPFITSCGSDDDDQLSTQSKPTVTAVNLYIYATPSADLLKYADLQFTYKDDQGANKYVEVDTTVFRVALSLTKFPVNGTLTYICKPKAGVTPDANTKVSMCTYYEVYQYAVYSDGTSERKVKKTGGGTQAFYTNKLSGWFASSDTLGSYTFSLDKDGNIIQ